MADTPVPSPSAPVAIGDARVGRRQWWVVFVASLGQIIGTGVATLVGVAIPMIQLVSHPELPGWMQGLLGAMDLVGISVGSLFIGRWSDRWGYLLFFRLCPVLVLVSTVVAMLFPSVGVLLVCLFCIGFGIGGEYSLDSDYVSELMPRHWRFLMVGVCKASCALGNICFAAGCLAVIALSPHPQAWPRLLWLIVILSSLMIVTRLRFAQSPRWLMDRGRAKEAQEAAERLLGPGIVVKALPKPAGPADVPGACPIRPTWRQIMLTGIPWACEGLGVYGIGVFIPILVMALGLEHPGAEGIARVESSVRVTLWISLIILPGFLIGLWMIWRKASLTGLQTWGFLLCCASLVVLLLAYEGGWPKWVSLAAFMSFELFLNIGPHLVSYVLPSRIFPVADRGTGSGVAASLGKIGAVLGVFFVPVLLQHGGARAVLVVSMAVMLIGGVVTFLFRNVAHNDEVKP